VQYGRNANPDNFWKTYFTSSKHVSYRLKQYGKECFQFEIRKTFDAPMKAKLWEERVLRRMKVVEKSEWLNKNDSIAPPHYTGEKNPFFGKHHSEETKNKVRKKAKNRFEDPTFVEKYASAMKNRNNDVHRTDEYRQMKSEKGKRNYELGISGINFDRSGSGNGMFGKTHSEDARKKMAEKKQGLYGGSSNPMFGKRHSDEVRKKQSELIKGRIWVRNGMQSKQIPLEQLDTYLNEGWNRGRAMDHRASEKYLLALLDKEKPVE
jgi:hypothetical protein